MRHNKTELAIVAFLIGLAIVLSIVLGCNRREPDQILPGPVASATIYRAGWCGSCMNPLEIELLIKRYPRVAFTVIDIDKVKNTGVSRIPFYTFCYADQCWPTTSTWEFKGWLEEYCK